MKKLLLLPLIAIYLLTACQTSTNKEGEAENTNDLSPPPIENGSDVVDFVTMENPPTYPGGVVEFYKFLGKNIKYPAEAIEKNIQGNVFISFVVEKDGSITDIKVDRKLGAGTDEEAIRVLKSSKKWIPGIQDGKPVRVKYKMPIKFALGK